MRSRRELVAEFRESLPAIMAMLAGHSAADADRRAAGRLWPSLRRGQPPCDGVRRLLSADPITVCAAAGGPHELGDFRPSVLRR